MVKKKSQKAPKINLTSKLHALRIPLPLSRELEKLAVKRKVSWSSLVKELLEEALGLNPGATEVTTYSAPHLGSSTAKLRGR